LSFNSEKHFILSGLILSKNFIIICTAGFCGTLGKEHTRKKGSLNVRKMEKEDLQNMK
jgi:hypothetical protein